MYRLRCRDCTKRFSLRKPPHQYARTPKCPECKSINWRDINAKDKQYDSARTCHCIGWPHPHRYGAVYDEYRTCRNADPKSIEDKEDAKWHEEILGAGTITDPDKCPF